MDFFGGKFLPKNGGLDLKGAFWEEVMKKRGLKKGFKKRGLSQREKPGGVFKKGGFFFGTKGQIEKIRLF